ncbi:hypothetical protein [Aidingimonas halophila]|uniref:Uncharacterized protein n=1 Tax=Aidingimonas halophila TaxID=574349 RepID=A0A1H2ZB66_9GAMM|nr:hypothetical protein [Aidingimonas halophila]GHC15608.1 hypothetical protein GCM10008094_00730 [Aidingimonas halophila]SDX14084.1 hypothetical protein SAMN05443545_10478 [Aidingimonas halophila]
MNDHQRDSRNNPAWQAAQRWRERARQSRPQGEISGVRLILTWLLFGVVMIIGTLLGLVFLLIGWAMLPFLRYRMKKRMERMRADQASNIDGNASGPESHDASSTQHDVLDGQYEVKDSEKR